MSRKVHLIPIHDYHFKLRIYRSTWQYAPSPSSKNCSSLTSCSVKIIKRSLVCASKGQLFENRCCKSIPTPTPKYDKCSFSCQMIWSEWTACSGMCACGTRVQTSQCMQMETKSGRVKPVNVKECRSVGLVDAAVSERKENCSSTVQPSAATKECRKRH